MDFARHCRDKDSPLKRIGVILPAAGRGRRFAAGDVASGSKIEFPLGDKPVFLHAAEAFRGHVAVAQIILAVAPDRLEAFGLRWGGELESLGIDLVAGGTAERWETVKLALAHVQPRITHIAVHDAARPLVSARLIQRLFDAADRWGAVVPALPVSDTLKRIIDAQTAPRTDTPTDRDRGDTILDHPTGDDPPPRRVAQTLSRADLVAVQTPQIFEIDLLRRAYAALPGFEGVTDDASIIEAYGQPVRVVRGQSSNLKITHPDDAELAQALLARRAAEDTA